MTFLSSITLLVLVAVAVPGSNAFQNGNNDPKVGISNKPPTTFNQAPMPFKWPIIGTIPDFFSRGGIDGMCDVHESMYHEYGPVYAMSLMGDDEIVFSDPRVFDQILRNEGKFPIGGAESVTTFNEYYEENDMKFALKGVQHGKEWKEYRSEMNPDLYVLWSTYLPIIADTCRKISKVAGRETTVTKNLHIADFLSRAAFDMFAAVLYGNSPETTNTHKAKPEDIAFVKATKKAFDITGVLITNPIEKARGSDLYNEFVVNMDKTVSLANKNGTEKIKSALKIKALHEAKVIEQQAPSSSENGCPITAIKQSVGLNRDKFIPTDFISPSFIERIVNRESLSIEQITEVQAPLLMAGVDTTAYVMSWFYLNLASNPMVQTKLAKELQEILQGSDITTIEQMESVPYLKACFRESHRLTPPGPILIKTLEKDISIVTGEDHKFYAIPAGQKISLNLRGMPMDPKYVEEPTSFIPERFSADAVMARKGTLSEIALDHPYMNDPFGRGKRRCLGANVAIAEMTVLAARLLQDWEISLVDPNEAVQSPTKKWKTKQKLMLIADPYPAMELNPRQKQ